MRHGPGRELAVEKPAIAIDGPQGSPIVFWMDDTFSIRLAVAVVIPKR